MKDRDGSPEPGQSGTDLPSDSLVRIGVLVRPFGLAGGLRCELDIDAVPIIATPARAFVGYSASFIEPIELRRCDSRNNDIICYFTGTERREDLDTLIDKGLWLPGEALSYADPNIHPRLFGYQVVDMKGHLLGTISSIVRSAAHPIWGITRDGVERLLPAVEPFVASIDHRERTVVIRPIPGLLDNDFEVGGGSDQS